MGSYQEMLAELTTALNEQSKQFERQIKSIQQQQKMQQQNLEQQLQQQQQRQLQQQQQLKNQIIQQMQQQLIQVQNDQALPKLNIQTETIESAPKAKKQKQKPAQMQRQPQLQQHPQEQPQQQHLQQQQLLQQQPQKKQPQQKQPQQQQPQQKQPQQQHPEQQHLQQQQPEPQPQQQLQNREGDIARPTSNSVSASTKNSTIKRKPKRSTIIFGSSIVRHVNSSNIWNSSKVAAKTNCYPGAGVMEISEHIDIKLKYLKQLPTTVILHGGGNDLTDGKPVENIVDEMKEL